MSNYPETVNELIAQISALNSGGGEIQLKPNHLYEFDSAYGGTDNALPIFTASITIKGNGATFQRQSTAGDFRFIELDPGLESEQSLTIYDLSFKGGKLSASATRAGALVVDRTVSPHGQISIQLVNCRFENNEAHYGGAFYIESANFECFIQNCHFEGNKATASGGAIWLNGTNEHLNWPKGLSIQKSVFLNNEADSGAALDGLLAPIEVLDSHFEGNNASAGDDVFNFSGSQLYPPRINYCSFLNNSSIVIHYNSDPLYSPVDARYNEWNGSPASQVEGDVEYSPSLGVGGASEHRGATHCPANYEGGDPKASENPISLRLAEKRLNETDLRINTPMGALAFTRLYRQSQQANLDFMGLGWTHSQDMWLEELGGSPNKIEVFMAGDTTVFYDDNADDVFEAAAGSVSHILKDMSGYDLTVSDESVYHFDSAGKLLSRSLPNGEVWSYSYSGTQLIEVTDGYGRKLKFVYYSGETGGNAFKNDKLKRIGTHTSSDLTNSPQVPYVELDYTDDGSGEALLTEVQDARGETWSYRYYGSESGETNPEWLNFLVERHSPLVDTDGDEIGNVGLLLESLSYAGEREAITEIEQLRGEGAIVNILSFDYENGQTIQRRAERETVHSFVNDVYSGTKNPADYGGSRVPVSNYRTAYQEDAKGNRSHLKWDDIGRTLTEVIDAAANRTSFSYDLLNRLFSSQDPEGKITIYGYDGAERQPNIIRLIEGNLVTNGDMELSGNWLNISGAAPTTNEKHRNAYTGRYSRRVVASAANQGIRSQNMELLSGVSYHLEAYVRPVSGRLKMEMGSSSVLSATATNTWEHLSLNYTPSSNENRRVQFRAEAGAAEFYIDAVFVWANEDLLRWQEFDYDTNGRVLEERQLDPTDGLTILQKKVMSYGSSGNGNGLLETLYTFDWDIESQTGIQYTMDYLYDPQGRVIKVSKNSIFGTCEYSYTVYDEAGNVLGSACGPSNETTPPSNLTELEALYDAGDELKSQMRITSHVYDAMGRRVQSTSNAGTGFARSNLTIYDALGRVIRSITNYHAANENEPLESYSAPLTWEWNAAAGYWQDVSDPTKIIEHSASSDVNIISETQYNARGLVKFRRDVVGRVTLYGYDLADRLVKTVQNASDAEYNNDYSGDPDLSSYIASNASDADLITEQGYDPNGNLVWSKDARANVTLTAYDALNRAVKVISNASQPDYDILADLDLSNYGLYSTDPDKDMVSETDYNALGQMIRSRRLLENRDGELWDVTLYGYDALGRQVSNIQHASQRDYNLAADPDLSEYILSSESDLDMLNESTYDSQGRLESTIDLNGQVNRIVYDGLNRQAKTIANYEIQGSSDPVDWVWANNQWEDGADNPIDHGSKLDKNIISETLYDEDGRILEHRNVEGFISRSAYDVTGRSVLSIQNYVAQGGSDPVDWLWADTLWEDGDDNPIDRGTGFDQNLISQPSYDEENRIFQSRDTRGNLSYQVYDPSGRVVLSIQNYVEQGSSEPEAWLWSTTNNRWEDGADNPILFGANNDHNQIQSSQYDLLGRVFRSRDALGRESYIVFDTLGRTIRRVQNYVEQGSSVPDAWLWDEIQARWEDGAGNPIAHGTAFDQNIISEMVYNQAGQVLSSRDARGTVTSFAYDAAGRRLITSQAANTPLATSSYSCYDKAGRVLRQILNYTEHLDENDVLVSPDSWDANGDWLFAPSEHGRDQDSNLISETVYDRASRRIQSIDPMGNFSSTSYTKDGQIKTMTDPEGMVTAFAYDALKRRTLVVQSYVAQGESAIQDWAWLNDQWEDGDANAIEHGANNDENIIIQVSYDLAGRVLEQREPRGKLTSYTYDRLGRRTSLTNPLSKVWETSYGEANGATQVSMAYPNGYTVQRDFDRFGRLLELDYGNAANTPTVNFAYDLLGNRLSMVENDGSNDIRITAYQYDLANRLQQLDFDTDADTVIEEAVSYAYDLGGLRTRLTMPGALDIIYSYDAKGRLITLKDWDEQTSRFSYDKANRHNSTMRPNGMRSRYLHDAAGHLKLLRHENKQRNTLAEFCYTVDGRGNRTQALELTQAGSVTSHVYAHTDEAVQYIGTWTNAVTQHETTKRDARLSLAFAGNTNLELLIATGPNHSIFDLYLDGTLYESYDAYAASSGSRQIDLTLEGDGWHVLELRNRPEKNLQSSGYKLAFRSLSVDTALQNTTIDYAYDGLSRLQSAVYADASRSWLYEYDLAGNRIKEEATVGITTSIAQWIYDEANRIATMQLGSNPAVNFQYDDNGNLLDDGQLTYIWDRANRLKTVNNGSYNTHYAYDGSGNRFQQTLGSAVTDYLLDLQPGLALVLRETSASDSFSYVYGPRGLQSIQNDSDWFDNLQDGLGSSRIQISDDFQIQASQAYSPYGLPFDINGSFTGSFSYANEQVDNNGLSNNRARYYNPSLGSFTRLDPFEGLIDEPMSLNGYSYVHSNPVNLTDASGMQPDCFAEDMQYNSLGDNDGSLEDYDQQQAMRAHQLSSMQHSLSDPAAVLQSMFCGNNSKAADPGNPPIDWEKLWKLIEAILKTLGELGELIAVIIGLILAILALLALIIFASIEWLVALLEILIDLLTLKNRAWSCNLKRHTYATAGTEFHQVIQAYFVQQNGAFPFTQVEGPLIPRAGTNGADGRPDAVIYWNNILNDPGQPVEIYELKPISYHTSTGKNLEGRAQLARYVDGWRANSIGGITNVVPGTRWNPNGHSLTSPIDSNQMLVLETHWNSIPEDAGMVYYFCRDKVTLA